MLIESQHLKDFALECHIQHMTYYSTAARYEHGSLGFYVITMRILGARLDIMDPKVKPHV